MSQETSAAATISIRRERRFAAWDRGNAGALTKLKL